MSGFACGRVVLILMLLPSLHARNTPTNVSIPDRLVFRVTAENKIDTRHAKAGDAVKMSLLEPQKLDDGTVIPVGAQLEGHIIETVAHSDGNPEARLTIVLDRIFWKKHSASIHAFIIAHGLLRKTLVIGRIKSPCFDPFTKGSTAEEVFCPENPRTAKTPGAKVSSDSPFLRDAEIVAIGSPPYGWSLVSHKRNIVIDSRMVFDVRNMLAESK